MLIYIIKTVYFTVEHVEAKSIMRARKNVDMVRTPANSKLPLVCSHRLQGKTHHIVPLPPTHTLYFFFSPLLNFLLKTTHIAQGLQMDLEPHVVINSF